MQSGIVGAPGRFGMLSASKELDRPLAGARAGKYLDRPALSLVRDLLEPLATP